MRSLIAAMTVLLVPALAWAAPGAAGPGKILAEYNPATGELIVSSGGVVNFFVQSASNKITPINPPPVVPVGLLTNNASRIGITNLGPINLTDFSFGSIGKHLSFDDLTINYTPALGQKAIVTPFCSVPSCMPEPSSLGLAGTGLFGLLATRRKNL